MQKSPGCLPSSPRAIHPPVLLLWKKSPQRQHALKCATDSSSRMAQMLTADYGALPGIILNKASS